MKNLILAILSGILFSLGWPTYGYPIFLFLAFVPLLLLSENFLKNTSHKYFFLYVYLAFFIWNLLKTWWIINSTVVGGMFAIVVNSLLMSLVFWSFHLIRKRLPQRMALAYLIFVWISFEKFHLDWDFSWPWLNLGNGFSEQTGWIQWYEYTGTFGGSFWILLVNIIAYHYISKYLQTKNRKYLITGGIKVLLYIILPIVLSQNIKTQYKIKGQTTKVSILQPNLDPWKEKFKYNNTELTENFLELANPEADLIVAPETAISQYIEITDFSYSRPYYLMKAFSKKYHTHILTGVDFIHWYPKNSLNIPETANKTRSGRWYDMYNSAVLVSPDDSVQIYHKSKLVVGAEYTPFRKILEPLIGDWVTKTIGVSMGSNVSQKERGVFKVSGTPIKVAPIICYESVYGAYVTDYVKKGANLLAVITNDGWWGNTEGHRQHLSIARLRAIENRRDVVQSANTGISAHINQLGNIEKSLGYNKRGNIDTIVHLNEQQTFYTQQGDYLARVAIFMTVLLLLYALSKHKVFLRLSAYMVMLFTEL